MSTFYKFLNENKDKNVISVDIQPMYKSYITFNLYRYFEWLSDQNNILFFYNGVETVGTDNESDLINFIIDHEFPEHKLNDITFYDKGYAFFRGWIDYGIDEDDILKVLKYMLSKRIYDSRDIDKHKMIKLLGYDEYPADDPLYFPDIPFSLLNRYRNGVLVGGGVNECLYEIELLLKAIRISYNKNRKYIY